MSSPAEPGLSAPAWQSPRKPIQPQEWVSPTPCRLHNRYQGLAEDTGKEIEGAEGFSFPKVPRRVKRQRGQVSVRMQEASSQPTPAYTEEVEKPYGSSYFLPGKVAGKSATFLIDTGCTTNLLSKRLFDSLSSKDRQEMQPYEGAHGTLADGSCIPFYGVITLPGRVRDYAIHETFIVSYLKEDAILGMPFLTKYQCTLDFQRSTVNVAGRDLRCVDKHGRPLVSGVQVIRDSVIPGRSQANLQCRVTCRDAPSLGIMEGDHGGIHVASSLNTLDEKGRFYVRCLNPADAPIRLGAGTLMGRFTSVQEEDVGPELGNEGEDQREYARCGCSVATLPRSRARQEDALCGYSTEAPRLVPEHAKGLYIDKQRNEGEDQREHARCSCSVGTLPRSRARQEDALCGYSTEAPRLVPEHVKCLFENAQGSCVSAREREQVARLLRDYEDVFSKGDQDMGLTDVVEHDIPLEEGTPPVRQPTRRLGPEKEKEVSKQVQDLLGRGLIEPSHSAWSSPVVLVRKKDGSWRFCVDYRRLNSVTIQDAYPLPRIDESLDALSGSRYFSTLDLLSGYWQVPLSESAQEKSAFITRDGLWKWKVLPFGLTSAPATFQRLMEQVLSGLHWKTLLLYLDDIVVIAPDFQTHLHRLEEVFRRLRKANLKLKPTKCSILQTEVKYLGHIVSSAGVATDPDKIAAVVEWPVPRNLHELRAFMGLVGYYRQYVPNFAGLARPLNQLTVKGAAWRWGVEEQKAFDQLKGSLVRAPILAYPDPAKPYIVDTDASDHNVGAVLSQVQGGREVVVAYFSKALAPAEKNYCTTRKELLAVVKAVKHFRPYLYGRPFRLRTDHASLIWLCKRTEPSSQVARWLEILSEFTYRIEHRPGKKHSNADGMSRRPNDPCKQCLNIEKRDGGPSRQEVEAQFQEPVVYSWEQGKLKESKAPADVGNRRTSPTLTHNTGQLRDLQANGPGVVTEMYQAKQSGRKPTENEVQLKDAEFKHLWNRWEALSIDPDGLLEISLAGDTRNGSRKRVICPVSLRREVIWDTHRQAHAGANRVLRCLRMRWYWPGMTRDVRVQLRQCEICQASKHGRAPETTGRRRLYAGRPWQVVAVDLVGPMPVSARGNSWILVLTDHFTRWSDAIAIPDATAPTVARTLDQRVFCYMGLPERIHSDQGAQFQAQLMTDLCQIWGVNQSRTTPYHPQGNGVVERNNRMLGDSLRSLLLGKTQDDWDEVLPQIMRAYRGTPHSSTEETPNMLMLGREVRVPEHVAYHIPERESPVHEYVAKLLERLQVAHSALREKQWKVREEDGEEPPLYQVGDWVWMVSYRRKRGQSAKLQPKFIGPYQVTECYENHSYKIERSGQVSIQNEKRLKPYHPSPDAVGQAPPLLEPRRRPNMRGTRQAEEEPEDLIPIPLEPRENQEPPPEVPREPPQEQPQESYQEPPQEQPQEPLQEPRVASPATQQAHNQGIPNGRETLEHPGRPTRQRRPPPHLSDYICDRMFQCDCGQCSTSGVEGPGKRETQGQEKAEEQQAPSKKHQAAKFGSPSLVPTSWSDVVKTSTSNRKGKSPGTERWETGPGQSNLLCPTPETQSEFPTPAEAQGVNAKKHRNPGRGIPPLTKHGRKFGSPNSAVQRHEVTACQEEDETTRHQAAHGTACTNEGSDQPKQVGGTMEKVTDQVRRIRRDLHR